MKKEIRPSWAMIGLGGSISMFVFWLGFKVMDSLFFGTLVPLIPTTTMWQVFAVFTYTAIVMTWAVLCVRFAKFLAKKGTELQLRDRES